MFHPIRMCMCDSGLSVTGMLVTLTIWYMYMYVHTLSLHVHTHVFYTPNLSVLHEKTGRVRETK